MQATLSAPKRLDTANDDDDIELSIVMPCLNEAKTVGVCVEKALRALAAMEVTGEVVVADNGSTDGSQEIARSHGVRVVNAVDKGYGAALQAGISAARGRYVVMGDADDSYDFSRLWEFLNRLRWGDDLVMGNRFRGGIRQGAMPWLHRYVGNPILSGILNLFFRTPIRDAHCGLRAFRKNSYQRLGLNTPGMEFASEMVVKASLNKQKISEVPIVLHPDGRDRAPHLRSFRDGWRHLRFLLLLCPTWLYLVPAGLLLTVGFGLMAWLTPGKQVVGSIGLDVHTMLFGSLCTILGYQTLWLGAFAKIFGWRSGILPATTFSAGIFRVVNLERGLLAGFGLLIVGLIFNLALVVQWLGQDLAPSRSPQLSGTRYGA